MPGMPTRIIILLSGMPATRKSTFGRYLAREHGFAHYDLECDPSGWPRPELEHTWNNDRSAFVAHVRQQRTVLNRGFPVHCLPWVNELRGLGVRLIWFDGDIPSAQKEFEKRADPRKGSVGNFKNQIEEIRKAGFPASLDCVVVPALSARGVFLDPRRIENLVFP